MSNGKLWFVHSTITEDDHRESTLGPMLKKPTQKEAEDLCLAYTGVPHDGTRPAYLEITSKSIYQDVEDLAKGEGIEEDLELVKSGKCQD